MKYIVTLFVTSLGQPHFFEVMFDNFLANYPLPSMSGPCQVKPNRLRDQHGWPNGLVSSGEAKESLAQPVALVGIMGVFFWGGDLQYKMRIKIKQNRQNGD